MVKKRYRYYWVVDDYNAKIRRAACSVDIYKHIQTEQTQYTDYNQAQGFPKDQDIFWTLQEARTRLRHRLSQSRLEALTRLRQCDTALARLGYCVKRHGRKHP